MSFGKMEDFTIDQFAGSAALILGSIGGLLMIIWKSRCECDINCCWLFRCHRSPPPNEGDSEGEENKPTPQPVEELTPANPQTIEREEP
tara:strand:+ start:7364 stop:7630 length:267 start_codon:yes stop_codon:yes gene_type:complete